MTELLQWDESVFHFINSGWQNSLFDTLMPVLRNKYVWFPAYLFLLSFLLLNFKRKGLYVALGFAIAIGLSDSISSQVVKKMVRRARPCKVMERPEEIHLLVKCGSGYSFPSNHAANHFSMAVFLSLTMGRVFRRIKIPLLLWAASVGLAQVYVGLHYPLDVAAGAILGSALALAVFRAFRPYLILSPQADNLNNQQIANN